MSENNLILHYKTLKQFLDISDVQSSKPKTTERTENARKKLLKLSHSQFRELSTDVYDELRRRIDESRGEPDFLLPKSSFHPKRNDARRKLSTLPQNRFKDLVADISFEIERRGLHIPKDDHVDASSVTSPTSLTRNDVQPRQVEDQTSKRATKETIASNEDSNVSKQSSDIPNQTIGVSSKTVVPTKANLTWSSDEENDDEDNEEDLNKDINAPNGSLTTEEPRPIGNIVPITTGIESSYKQEIDQLRDQLNAKESELQKLQAQHYDLQSKHTENLQKIQAHENERTSYDKKIEELSDRTEVENLKKELELIKSANAALRLENQGLKNSVSRDHTRNSSINTLSKDIQEPATESAVAGAVVGGAAGIAGSRAINGSSSANDEMKLILEKLSNLDKAPVSSKSSFIQLKNDVTKWQKKYEDLRSDKLLKRFNDDLLSKQQLQNLVASNGSVSIHLVTKFHANVETFLNSLDDKDTDSDLLFEKISKISLLANEIANQGEGNLINTNPLSTKVRDSASYNLTLTRYYSLYSNLIPKLVLERSLNDLNFSICELIGKVKLSTNEHINYGYSKSISEEVASKNVSTVSVNGSIPYQDDDSEPDTSSIGVRPLRMANKLKSNSSVNSFESAKETSPRGISKTIASKFDNKVDNDPPVAPESTKTPTKRSNILDRVKQFESPPPSDIPKKVTQFGKSPSGDVAQRSKQFDSPPPTTTQKRTSFSPPPAGNDSGNSFVLNRSSLEMKKSPKTVVTEQDLVNGTGATGPINTKKESSGVASSGAADIASAPKSRGIFQSIKQKFTDAGNDAVVADKQSEKHDTSNDSMTTSTAETTPSKENVSDDFDLTPNKSFQSVQKSIIDSGVDRRVPSSSNSDVTVKPDEIVEKKKVKISSESPKKYGHSIDDSFDEEPISNSSPISKKSFELDKEEPVPVRSFSLRSQEKAAPSNGFSTKSQEVQKDFVDPVQVTQKQKVATKSAPIVQAPVVQAPVVQAPVRSKEESDEESDEEVDGGAEDDQTSKARQRQEYRKSMAAATFNVDLFDVEDPDNTLTQVLLYLEHQTVEVINTIQVLLSAIKKPSATRGDLREKSKAITEVISQMTAATNTSMDQTRNAQLKEHGTWVVKSLEDCYHRMNILCKPSNDKKDTEFADRSFKQRLAGISFDIAKCTKELVKTVEEASLKEDIANLDARLSHGDDLL